MHSGHCQMMRACIIDIIASGIYGSIFVHIVCGTYFGVIQLQVYTVHDVAHYQEIAHAIDRMSGGMTCRFHGDNPTGKRVVKREEMQPVLVSIHGFYDHIVFPCHLEPCLIFHLGSVYLSIREHDGIAPHQPSDVVTVKVCQVDIFDLFGRNAVCF